MKETMREENPYRAMGEEIAQLEAEGKLPEGFDLESAVQDRVFAELLQEFEPKAAVRIYAAERRAEDAEQNAKARMSEQLKTRSALPKSQRTDRAITASPDYMHMSREAFHALEQQYKNAAHNGKRIHM